MTLTEIVILTLAGAVVGWSVMTIRGRSEVGALVRFLGAVLGLVVIFVIVGAQIEGTRTGASVPPPTENVITDAPTPELEDGSSGLDEAMDEARDAAENAGP